MEGKWHKRVEAYSPDSSLVAGPVCVRRSCRPLRPASHSLMAAPCPQNACKSKLMHVGGSLTEMRVVLQFSLCSLRNLIHFVLCLFSSSLHCRRGFCLTHTHEIYWFEDIVQPSFLRRSTWHKSCSLASSGRRPVKRFVWCDVSGADLGGRRS